MKTIEGVSEIFIIWLKYFNKLWYRTSVCTGDNKNKNKGKGEGRSGGNKSFKEKTGTGTGSASLLDNSCLFI